MQAKIRSVLVLIAIMTATFAVAGFAAQFRPGLWYANLAKPLWTPPDFLFAPVWTLLYAMMAWAAWLVWRRRGWQSRPFALYVAQLILNGAWSWLFFGLQRLDLGAVEIVLLLLLIIATTVEFWRASRWAGALLLPYAAWVGFAAALNAAIWELNR